MVLNKIVKSLKNDGIIETIKKAVQYPYHFFEKRKFEKQLSKLNSTEDKFTWIYKSNYWGHESVSGPGSTLRYTENIRKELPKLITAFDIKSIFDAPCGDLNWMKLLLPTLNIHYIGADIVKDLIAAHQSNYKNDTTQFMQLNLVTDAFPNADLMICRDCLFHLSYNDIRNVLWNFVNSEISYLLTTTHKNKNNFENSDIKTGDFRRIDLFSTPFNFQSTPLYRMDDWMPPEPEREMCLFSKEQIRSALNKMPSKI